MSSADEIVEVVRALLRFCEAVDHEASGLPEPLDHLVALPREAVNRLRSAADPLTRDAPPCPCSIRDKTHAPGCLYAD